MEGLNPSDAGLVLLGRALRDAHGDVLLIACGTPPGAPTGEAAGVTALVADVRELGPSATSIVPALRGQVDPADVAALWPRAHLGKDFALQTIALAARALRVGGRVLCAARKRKGAEGYADFIRKVLGNVRTLARDRGYHLLCGVRAAALDEASIEECLAQRYELRDPALGELVLTSFPGTFARRELDAGTRCLLAFVAAQNPDPVSVLDLGAGVGPLALTAAARWPKASVLAVESNLIAADACERNAAQFGDRVQVLRADGVPDGPVQFDLALSNPPTHADQPTLLRLISDVGSRLRRGAPFWMVSSRAEVVAGPARRAGARVEIHPAERFAVVSATWPA